MFLVVVMQRMTGHHEYAIATYNLVLPHLLSGGSKRAANIHAAGRRAGICEQCQPDLFKQTPKPHSSGFCLGVMGCVFSTHIWRMPWSSRNVSHHCRVLAASQGFAQFALGKPQCSQAKDSQASVNKQTDAWTRLPLELPWHLPQSTLEVLLVVSLKLRCEPKVFAE